MDWQCKPSKEECNRRFLPRVHWGPWEIETAIAAFEVAMVGAAGWRAQRRYNGPHSDAVSVEKFESLFERENENQPRCNEPQITGTNMNENNNLHSFLWQKPNSFLGLTMNTEAGSNNSFS